MLLEISKAVECLNACSRKQATYLPLLSHGKLSTEDTNAQSQNGNQRWGREEGVIETSRTPKGLLWKDFLCDLQTVREQKQFMFQCHSGKNPHDP